MNRVDTLRKITEILEITKDNPSLFNEAVLGGGEFWEKQKEMSDMVMRKAITCIVSGNSVGKSYWASRICLWYLFTRPNSIVLTSAPTHNQLATVLWGNLRKAYSESRIPLGGAITSSPGASPQVLRLEPDWYMVGLSSTATEKLSGYHAPGGVMVVIDEASGITDEVFNAITSLAAEKIVLIGNPLRNSGPFYDLVRRAERGSEDIGVLKVSSLESPDIALEVSPRGLACRKWLREAKEIYGEGSAWYKSHVLAEFPSESDEVLIPSAWLDGLDEIEHKRGGPIKIGVDLALGRGGDKSVIIARDDNGILEILASSAWSLEETAGKVAMVAQKYGVKGGSIGYDATGGGTDFANRLLAHGLKQTYAYEGSRSASHRGLFANLRTAAAWTMRHRFDPKRLDRTGKVQARFAIQRDHLVLLRRQLGALTCSNAIEGKLRLDAKTDVASRLGESPDYADALIISFSFT